MFPGFAGAKSLAGVRDQISVLVVNLGVLACRRSGLTSSQGRAVFTRAHKSAGPRGAAAGEKRSPNTPLEILRERVCISALLITKKKDSWIRLTAGTIHIFTRRWVCSLLIYI